MTGHSGDGSCSHNGPSSAHDDDDDIEITLAPHIQSYLNQTGRRHSCCSVMLPVAFERAAANSWLNPVFDSSVLEQQYQISLFPHIRMRYRFALSYIFLCALIWFIYFLVYDIGDQDHSAWPLLALVFSVLALTALATFFFTHCRAYRHNHIIASTCTALTLCSASLAFVGLTGDTFSPLGHFAVCLEIVMLIYTALPMKLWLSTVIAITYTILFEIVNCLVEAGDAIHGSSTEFYVKILILRILSHFGVHLVGLHILIMNVVRMRGTFMKVGQNLLVRRQYEMEKQLKEKMIHSVMPPKVAALLLHEASIDGAVDTTTLRRISHLRPRPSNDVKSLFRPFHVHSMDDVSILFADIVGFTRMSSTKTAEQLVEILNDLFERFDELCLTNGCEKISTLGDCYYCVSGCPEPRDDHAACCVEMGLGMIEAMRTFDAQRHEGVKMRVGVHTGSVLCGIVGTRRVKFDVWSNDVSLANKMESSGKPEQVHISEVTAKFLGDAYLLEEGDDFFGQRTYFVVSRRKGVSRTSSISPSNYSNPPNNYTLSVQGKGQRTPLSLSSTNLSVVHPSVPPASPAEQNSASLSPSPVLRIKRRLNSISNKMQRKSQSKDLDIEKQQVLKYSEELRNENQPKIIVTTKSLPDSLDQEIILLQPNSVIEERNNYEGTAKDKPEGYSKLTYNLWKIAKFWKRIEDFGTTPAETSNEPQISPDAKSCGTEGAVETLVSDNSTGERQPVISTDESLAFINSNSTSNPGTSAVAFNALEERKTSKSNMLEIPQKQTLCRFYSTASAGASIGANRSVENSSCSPGQYSMFDDIIDVRSYISQSRSDISPFGRSNSYRSRVPQASTSCHGQSATVTHSELMPESRGRIQRLELPPTTAPAITVVAQPNTHSRNSSLIPDGLSISPSATSRKDSGIKSNSRRSSIQQQIYALNPNVNNQHRVSGYFTSSMSSISNMGEMSPLPHIPLRRLTDFQPPANADPLAACLQQLRKQSDLQLIRCVRENARSQRSYLVKPPLRKMSLYFRSQPLEKEFRSKAHRFGMENEMDAPPTLATPRYNTCLDMLVGLVVYLCIAVSLLLMTPNNLLFTCHWWMFLFIGFTLLQLFALFVFVQQMCRRYSMNSRYKESPDEAQGKERCTDRIFEAISNWYPWHVCLAILMSLPVILIISNFLLLNLEELEAFEYHYGILIFVCIVHFCNFTQLNCWMRNILAFMAAMCFVCIAMSQLLASANRLDTSPNHLNATAMTYTLNTTTTNTTTTTEIDDREKTERLINFILEEMTWFRNYHVETYLDLFLVLVLVWFLNREFEIGYRLTFYGNAVAKQDKINVQNMKNQADMLLHNIIPKHVAEQLKNTAKYSENHYNVAIIFASIVNFNELYDESYLGGKEYLRVLNELVGDFDELLSRTEFKCIEKIKTIGSTFMAASGLDPSKRSSAGHEHIHALMEFSLAMREVIDAFNKDLLEFNLILRIGFNVGDVTAGVIGTSKLLYDIWGDAVNVASRMDSTGVPNRIQVGKDCLQFLEDRYEFEPRGSVFVKGKDNMEVYLFTRRKPVDNDDR